MNQKAELFVDSRCELGEGPFWHPLLGRLFWFDILNQTLMSATPDGQLVDRITFKDTVSAAAVVDANTLVVAQSGALVRYEFDTDSHTVIDGIEADVPGNRTNDSRMDRSGADLTRAGMIMGMVISILWILTLLGIGGIVFLAAMAS